MLAPPLVEFLRARRVDCNARFAAARRRWPRLDAADFSLFLRDQLSPLAAALGSVAPDHAHVVLDRAYGLGLQLVAEKLAGPAASTHGINALWTDCFPAMATLVATASERILGALSNAAHHLDSTPEARADIWRNRLVELMPRCSNTEELLIVSQVLAWRSGLAHFRDSAIAVADALPADLALEAFEAPTEMNWPEVRDAHLANPWFGYDSSQRAMDRTSLVRRIGAFRGFGGQFISPPLVTQSGSHILVRSGDEAWILLADAFGATLHRAATDEIAIAVPIAPTSHRSDHLPPGHTATSAITLGATHAVTSGQSHSIWVVPATADR